jgi:CHAD domain-containing protein
MAKVTKQEIFNPRKNLVECLLIIFNARITRLYSYKDSVFEDEDVEALHDMRVSARRLQAVFKIFKPLFPKKGYRENYQKVRGIVKLLGIVRESDVTLSIIENFMNNSDLKDKRILLLLLARLKNKNLYERKIISSNKMLKDFSSHEDQLVRFVESSLFHPGKDVKDKYIEKSFREYAFMIIPPMYDSVMEFRPRVLDHPGRIEELHRMRIQTKPLRYALETYQDIFSDDFKRNLKEVKSFVERMGTIHDIDVLLPILKDFEKEIKIYNSSLENRTQRIPTTALRELIKKMNADRDKNFKELCDILRKWRRENFKEKLIESMG